MGSNSSEICQDHCHDCHLPPSVLGAAYQRYGAHRENDAYGREVLRVLKEMQKLGPWKFGPRISERIFKK